MEEKDHTIQYTYDTPNNLITKEGDFFRNLVSSTVQRPLYVRICIAIFSVLMLIVPGVAFTLLALTTIKGYEVALISRIAGLVIGIFFTILGLIIVYKNIKKSSQ